MVSEYGWYVSMYNVWHGMCVVWECVWYGRSPFVLRLSLRLLGALLVTLSMYQEQPKHLLLLTSGTQFSSFLKSMLGVLAENKPHSIVLY